MNLIKRFSITKYNCNEKFIENLFKHYDINSQNKLRKVCLNKESLSNSEILITSIKDQVCGKIVKNKNKKFVNLKEDYRPSKHDIKFIKLLINTLKEGLKERKEFEKLSSKKEIQNLKKDQLNYQDG